VTEQEDRFARAIELQARVFGEESAGRVRESVGRGYRTKGMRDFNEITMGHVFVDMWSRPGLDLRSRSIVQIAGLMAMRQWDEFEIHVKYGLRNGLTPDEIMEIVLQMTVYGGQALGRTAYSHVATVFRAQGIDERASAQE